MKLQLLSLSFLAALLLVAVVSDVRRRRIPNALVLYGMLLGLAFQCFAAPGGGLLHGSGLGWSGAVLGGLAGLALFMPLYALRMMAAGDVKLLAMVGVWLGAASVVHAALWSLLAGGVLAAVAMTTSGVAGRVTHNLWTLLGNVVRRSRGAAALPATAVTGKLPYALAIAAGSAAEMARVLHAI